MAEENLSPISAPKPPAANPLGATTSAHASTLKLKPVIRKPTLGGGLKPGLRMPTKPGLKVPTATAKPAAPAAPAAPAPAPTAAVPPVSDSMDQLKSVTQKLKGITQQIPAQAILRKTGIIADQDLTDAQKQASKSRTARISLSDVGVAPVQNEAAPMKTIRIKRPGDLKPTVQAAPAPAPAAAPATTAPEAAKPASEQPTLTQRKTLKVARPTAGGVRPTGKFGLKKPGAATATKPAEGGDANAEVADIPDLPAEAAKPAAAPAPAAPVVEPISTFSLITTIVQAAACAGIFFLSYLLIMDAQTKWF